MDIAQGNVHAQLLGQVFQRIGNDNIAEGLAHLHDVIQVGNRSSLGVGTALTEEHGHIVGNQAFFLDGVILLLVNQHIIVCAGFPGIERQTQAVVVAVKALTLAVNHLIVQIQHQRGQQALVIVGVIIGADDVVQSSNVVFHSHIGIVQRTAQLQALRDAEAIALGHALGVPHGAGVLGGHFGIADVAAVRQHNAVGVNTVNGAVIGNGLHAHNLAVLFQQAGSPQLSLIVVLLVVGQSLCHGSIVGIVLAAAVLAGVHGPQLPAVGIVEGEHGGQERKVIVVCQPAEGLAGLVDEQLDDFALGIVLAVFHPGSIQLIGVNEVLAAVGFHLGSGVHAHRAGGVGAVAANLGSGFHAEHGAAVLGSAQEAGNAGGAQTHNGNIIIPQLHHLSGLLNRGVPTGGIAAVGINHIAQDGLGCIAGHGSAADGIHIQALRLDDAGVQLFLHSSVDVAVFILIVLRGRTGANRLNGYNGVVLEGNRQLHLLHNTEGRCLAGISTVGNIALVRAGLTGSLCQCSSRSRLDGSGSDGSTGNTVHICTLGFQNGICHGFQGGDSHAGGLVGSLCLNSSDGILGNGHRHRNGAAHALRLGSIGAGGVASVGSSHAQNRHQHGADQHESNQRFFHG